MSKASGVVEINGNRYDASTGQVIGSVKKSAHHLKTTASGVVDGVFRQSSVVAAKKKSTVVRARHTAQVFHKTTQRSKTLMRSAVKKPGAQHSNAHAVSHPTAAASHQPQAKHASRVSSVPQHKKINRFGHIHKAAPRHQPTGQTGGMKPKNNIKHATAAVSPSMVSSASHSHIERLLDEALNSNNISSRRRSSHSLWHRIKIMPRWLSLGLASFFIALATGFFAWQNIPQAAIKVASARAGFNASAPSYTPDGYRFSAPISYSRGEVALKYQSSKGQSYRITQQSSKLDSTTLASSVLTDESNVQTSQVKGTTVYIYGDKNEATWVNNGVRYTIADQNGLDSDQILKIAGSL